MDFFPSIFLYALLLLVFTGLIRIGTRWFEWLSVAALILLCLAAVPYSVKIFSRLAHWQQVSLTVICVLVVSYLNVMFLKAALTLITDRNKKKGYPKGRSRSLPADKTPSAGKNIPPGIRKPK